MDVIIQQKKFSYRITMIFSERSKEKIALLAKMIMNQPNGVDVLSVEINDNFNIEGYIPALLEGGRWDLAVDPQAIADPNSDDDKFTRANGILQLVINEPLVNTKFLDFGCGEGHTVVEAARQSTIAVGYDIQDHQKWRAFPTKSNRILTSKWEDVTENAPYDIILIYDVLDHVADEQEAISCLTKIKNVLNKKGKIFVRFHPWCSRTGTHLYQQINCAFLHLCLNNDQLNKLGYKQDHTIKVIHPQLTYKDWFTKAGLINIGLTIHREPVSKFFTEPPISSLIKKHWKDSHDESLANGQILPTFQLEQHFLDFTLVRPEHDK